MSSTTKHTMERCATCGGRLHKATITHEERRGTNRSRFQNVPAQVCTGYREVWIAELTPRGIDQVMKKTSRVRFRKRLRDGALLARGEEDEPDARRGHGVSLLLAVHSKTPGAPSRAAVSPASPMSRV